MTLDFVLENHSYITVVVVYTSIPKKNSEQGFLPTFCVIKTKTISSELLVPLYISMGNLLTFNYIANLIVMFKYIKHLKTPSMGILFKILH